MLEGMDQHAHSGGGGGGGGRKRVLIAGAAALAAWMALASTSRADVDPVSGIDFVRVGAVGNTPIPDTIAGVGRAAGRGGVNYSYSIGKYEVTSGQWAEFFSAVQACPDGTVPFVHLPSITGGTTHPMYPTGGITWRTAAIFTNWLNNNKDNHLASFMNGAYDVSTFGFTPGGRFTDQLTHNPEARYWIPTWDEWLKAAHYDMNKANPDGSRGGWWTYSNGSDSPWVAGPPGILVNGQPATANYGWNSITFPGYDPFSTPLGAYAATSPFGLYDVAGGTSEWTEGALFVVPTDTYPIDRMFDGSCYNGSGIPDRIGALSGSDSPSYGGAEVGLRIASSVPSPGPCSLGLGIVFLSTLRRRRHHETRGWVCRAPWSGRRFGLGSNPVPDQRR